MSAAKEEVTVYIVEWFATRHPTWAPICSETYIDLDLAEMMAKAWVRNSPADTEFRIAPYTRNEHEIEAIARSLSPLSRLKS